MLYFGTEHVQILFSYTETIVSLMCTIKYGQGYINIDKII